MPSSTRTQQVISRPVQKGDLMPVVWEVVGSQGVGPDADVYLHGYVITMLVNGADADQRSIQATIKMSQIEGGWLYIPNGSLLVSCPAKSQWVSSAERERIFAQRVPPFSRFDPRLIEPQPSTTPFAPRVDPSLPPESFQSTPQEYTWDYVSNISNHAKFFLLFSDTSSRMKVENIIIFVEREHTVNRRTGKKIDLSLDVWITALADQSAKHRLQSQAVIKPSQGAKRYHPYIDEFESPVMSEWTELLPPVLFVPELAEDDSYTLIGYVALSIPPQSIQIRREHEMETQPVLRSSTLHKSPRANLHHEWSMSFVVQGEDINRKLVPLLRQIDRCPFLPIVNTMFAQMGIFEIAVTNVEVSTLPDHPNAFQVTLSGQKFDTGGLGFSLPYMSCFNWPLFKMYCDYLPRFLPIDLPMDEKVQVLVPSDEYVASLLDKVFETNQVAVKLGLGGASGFDLELPIDASVLDEPNVGKFALLPLPEDNTQIARYEVIVVDRPGDFRTIARAVLQGSLAGLEARRISIDSDGKARISVGVIPPTELERLLKEVESGNSQRQQAAMKQVAFCWRFDSRDRIKDVHVQTTLKRLLEGAKSTTSSSLRNKVSGPASMGKPLAFPSPEYVPFLPEDIEIVWTSVSAGFSNLITSLRRDVGDPVMQYLGKTDVTIVLQGQTNGDGVVWLRSLFDRYIALTYMLRGLSFLLPIRINFQIRNEIARLMGLEEVAPISLDIQNIEGHPDHYTVTLTFVGFDPGGVQRRTMRRLSESVGKEGRMFSFSFSGVDAAKELDRLTASLRRSELYPDLRLPTYGVLLEWARTLAYGLTGSDDKFPLRQFALSSLRDLAPGLDRVQTGDGRNAFEVYVRDVSSAMAKFVSDLYNHGLAERMKRIPYVFADPDFFFHDGDGIGPQIRRLVTKQLQSGDPGDVLFTDDSGVTASVSSQEGQFEVKIHDSQSSLRESVSKANRTVEKFYPQLTSKWVASNGPNAKSIVEHWEEVVTSDTLDRAARAFGGAPSPGGDVLSAIVASSQQDYMEFNKSYRESMALPDRTDFLKYYTHDVRSPDAAKSAAEVEKSQSDSIKEKAKAFAETLGIKLGSPDISFPADITKSPTVNTSDVSLGLYVLIQSAVDQMTRQIGTADRQKQSFYVKNGATLLNNPAQFTVAWTPNQWGVTSKIIRMTSPVLVPFMLGMLDQESSFNPNAKSSAGALGVGQFLESTWVGLLKRYRISGNLPEVPDRTRWDVAGIVSLYYLLELVSDAVTTVIVRSKNKSSTDKKLVEDFATYVCAYVPQRRKSVEEKPQSVLDQPDRSFALQLLVLGSLLYNAGPGRLGTILSQLADNVRRGASGSAMYSVPATNPNHGKLVYEKTLQWTDVLRSAKVLDGKATASGKGSFNEVGSTLSPDKFRQFGDFRTPPNVANLPDNAGDPFRQVHTLANFPLLPMTGWSDMVRHQPHGRLLQCFPTYCLLLVQGGRWVRWHRFWDHFYGLFSVMSIDVHKSRENPQHTAEILLSNSYRQLSNLTVTQAYAQAAIAGMRPFQQVQGEELMRGGTSDSTKAFLSQLVKSVQNSLFPILGEYERHVWNQELKSLFLHPGERIHLRMGYGADAAALPVVFNGTIAGVDIQGSVLRLLALGDGREFLREIATEGQPYKNSNLFGQTVEIRNVLIDILASRRADSIPVLGPVVYTFSGGGMLNDSRFGIESFGRVEALGGSTAAAESATGQWSAQSIKLFGVLSFQAGEGEVGVNIYNSQRDSTNVSIGMLPLLDTLTLGLSQIAHNGDFVAIELKEGTTWDVIRNCQLAMLDAIASVEPFGLRSTLFFGRGHQALHYSYYDSLQLEALGISNLASQISFGGYWRIMRFKQFRQYHIAVSEWNLISNELQATSERMWTEAQVFDAQGVPGNKYVFDPAIVPEERKSMSFHSALSTTLMSQLSLGAESNWVSVLARIGFVRNLLGERLGLAMPIRVVNNAAANLVREGISLMYDGSLIMLGAAEIKPHDFIFISDQLRAMEGPVIVREVDHHFSTEHGYTTLVVPDACVLGNGDIDTINLVQFSRMARNMVLFYLLRKDLILIYRSYLFLLLNGLAVALARLRFGILGRQVTLFPFLNRVLQVLGKLSKTVAPDYKEVIQLIMRAAVGGFQSGRTFFQTLFHGAWTRASMKPWLSGIVSDLKGVFASIFKEGNAEKAATFFVQLLERAKTLGTVRPLLNIRSVLTAVGKAVADKVGVIISVGLTVVEMINRKLGSYYPCRLYPVKVNNLPLTAGIRGHFGTVSGDDPAPLQRALNALTLSGGDNDKETFATLRAIGISPILSLINRDVPAFIAEDEELQNASAPFQRRGGYGMFNVIGSIYENYNRLPTLVRTKGMEEFHRNFVSYDQSSDPTRGDYLLDSPRVHPQAARVLKDLVQRLRSRGVPIAIRQAWRSLEEQAMLRQRLGTRAARPSQEAPHVSGRAIDVVYRHPNGTYSAYPTQSQMQTIRQVLLEINREYAPYMRVRWLGEPKGGEPNEPWHFDVVFR